MINATQFGELAGDAVELMFEARDLRAELGVDEACKSRELARLVSDEVWSLSTAEGLLLDHEREVLAGRFA